MSISGITRVLAAAISITPAVSCAQSSTFQPFPPGTEGRYHFDLSRTLFASRDVERSQADTAIEIALRASALASSAATSAHALLSMLKTADSADLRLARHYAYFTLLSSIDTRSASPQSDMNALYASVRPSLGRVNAVLASLDDSTLRKFVREVPALNTYEFAIRQARNTLPAATPDARTRQWMQVVNSGPSRFQTTFGNLDLGKLETPEGTLDVRTKILYMLSHPDRSIREAGFRRNTLGIAARRDTFADILTSVASARNSLAKSQGFSDYREQSYGERNLTIENMRNIFAALRTAARENKDYERLQKDRIARRFGYSTVHWWDLMAPLPERTVPRFRIDEATRIALDAAAPLGPAYVDELRALLDPRNGRLDIAPAPYKAERLGFSTGLVGYPSHFYQGRYSGLISDLIILVHEAGHGVQNMLMDRQGVIPRYAFGASYFTESYAALSELLVLEHLAKSTSDTSLRIYYMERLLDQASGMYRNGFEAQFEDSVYALVGAGQKPTADDLERLHHAIASQYSIWYGPGSDLTLQWVQPQPFYTRPLYEANYMLASLLALNYVQLQKQDPAGFQRRYQSLLSRGYDAAPADLLEQELGLKIDDPQRLISNASSVIRAWREELAALTR